MFGWRRTVPVLINESNLDPDRKTRCPWCVERWERYWQASMGLWEYTFPDFINHLIDDHHIEPERLQIVSDISIPQPD